MIDPTKPPLPSATRPPHSAGLSASPETDWDIPIALLHHPHYRIDRELGRGGMGGRLPRPQHAARPAGGFESHQPRPARPARRRRAVPPRNAGGGPPEPSERGRRIQRPVRRHVPGDGHGVRAGTGPVEAGPRERPAERAAGLLLHRAGRRRVAARARQRHGPPRHQARQHDGLDGGEKPAVKILDFGLAKATQAGGDALTASGALFGTPEYMAPEQALDAASADIRSDIYSLGCTLYFCLTGQSPVSAPSMYASMYAIMHAHQTAPLPDPSTVRDDVAPELLHILMRMMAKTPADRYPSPGHVAVALKPLFDPRLSAESPAAPAAQHQRVVSPPTPVPPPIRVGQVMEDSTADSEPRLGAPDRETEPPRDNTPVVQRMPMPAQSYQIDADQFKAGAAAYAAATRKAKPKRWRKQRKSGMFSKFNLMTAGISGCMALIVFGLSIRFKNSSGNNVAGKDSGATLNSYSNNDANASGGWKGDVTDWLEQGPMLSTMPARPNGKSSLLFRSATSSHYDISFGAKLKDGIGKAMFHFCSDEKSNLLDGPVCGIGQGIWGTLRLKRNTEVYTYAEFGLFKFLADSSAADFLLGDKQRIRLTVKDTRIILSLNDVPA